MHQAVGLVEMSSYAKFMVEGPDAERFLDHVGSAKCPPAEGKIAVSLILNERGGIVGDMTICRLDANRFYIVGATLAENIYRRWFDNHRSGFDVTIKVITPDHAALGITGPSSRALLQSLCNVGRAAVDAERDKMPRRSLATLVVDADGADCWGSEPIFRNGTLIGYVTSGGFG